MSNQEFDMWEVLGIPCAGYSSSLDEAMIGVLCGIKDKKFNSDIAHELNLNEDFVELMQSIACSAKLATYGTSPRGAFPEDEKALSIFIEKADEQFKKKWAE